jgi:Protoglobin
MELRRHPGADMEGFVRDLAAFVGFDDAAMTAVRASAPAVLKHEAALTAAVYEHFLKFPASARFFLGPDGAPDAARIERRRHSLGRWLRESAEAALTHDFAYYLLGVGIAHSHREFGPGGKIPPQLMVATMSLTQSALAGVLRAEMPAEAALDAAVAWNKLLLIHLNVFLVGYFLPEA